MADRHLDDAKAAPADARQELGRDHGPVGLELDAVEGRAAEELEGAVHVAHGQAEEGAHEEVPGGGVQPARERIGARVAVADHHVSAVHPVDQRRDLGRVELAVAVGEEDVVVARGAEAGANGGAVTPADRMMDDADLRMGAGELVRERPGRVPASVVDDDELPALGDRRQDAEHRLRHGQEVRLLVAGREEGREARQRRDGLYSQRRAGLFRGNRRAHRACLPDGGAESKRRHLRRRTSTRSWRWVEKRCGLASTSSQPAGAFHARQRAWSRM